MASVITRSWRPSKFDRLIDRSIDRLNCMLMWRFILLLWIWNIQYRAWGFDFRRNDKLLPTTYGQYSTELFTSEAESIIANHDTSKVYVDNYVCMWICAWVHVCIFFMSKHFACTSICELL